MRIVQLHSENIKRVKAIDITPDNDVIVLSGQNGEGKTSVLDSIWLALEFRAASKGNPTPLRAGQDKGIVTVDLGDYIVTRRFTPTGTTLEVRTPDGSKISSPQKLLDGMIGDLSFDPWEFSRKNDKEQGKMLGDVLYAITDGKVDLTSFEIKHKTLFEERSDANREQKRLTTALTMIRPPTKEDPTEEISVDELTKSISDATSINSQAEILGARSEQLRKRIEMLEKELSEVRTEYETTNAELGKLPMDEMPDVEYLKSRLSDVESINRRAREVKEYVKTKKALIAVNEKVASLNEAMELVSIERQEALEESPLPVKGLSVTPDGIRVLNENDELIPFCQASAAQRLRISLGIAMAANPKLRVIRIADGSLLDDNSMQIVKDMASDKDFQIWVEYASRNDNDRIGVYIQDGTIA